jgi:hypothetical protein
MTRNVTDFVVALLIKPELLLQEPILGLQVLDVSMTVQCAHSNQSSVLDRLLFREGRFSASCRGIDALLPSLLAGSARRTYPIATILLGSTEIAGIANATTLRMRIRAITVLRHHVKAGRLAGRKT